MTTRMMLIGLLTLLALPVSATSLQARLDALAPGEWLDYEVPMQPGVRAPCCFDWKSSQARDVPCRLDRNDWNFGHRDSDPVAGASDRLRVLLRRGDPGFDRVRVLGAQCPLEVAGARLVQAGSIEAGSSVELLSTAMASHADSERTHLLAAIAHHAGNAADAALAAAAAPGEMEDQRRDAVFWLAQARGGFGFRVVRDLLQDEASEALRRHEVFALSISEEPAAVTELIRITREHAASDVRAEAIFWLAQRGDARTEQLVAHALEHESSAQVREHAVFALSQLPAARAIPALRALVERRDLPEARSKALFWLAQVDDDAVLPVFDQLLREAAD